MEYDVAGRQPAAMYLQRKIFGFENRLRLCGCWAAQGRSEEVENLLASQAKICPGTRSQGSGGMLRELKRPKISNGKWAVPTATAVFEWRPENRKLANNLMEYVAKGTCFTDKCIMCSVSRRNVFCVHRYMWLRNKL